MAPVRALIKRFECAMVTSSAAEELCSEANIRYVQVRSTEAGCFCSALTKETRDSISFAVDR